MARIVLIGLFLALALWLADARDHAGRALYHAGFPAIGAAIAGGPIWSAAAFYQNGRYAEAAEAFRAAGDFAGKDYNLGTALARAGRLKEAADAFDAALVIDPNDADARFNLAIVEALMQRGRADGADAGGAASAAATENKRSNTSSDAESGVNSTGAGAAGDRDSGERATNAGPSKVDRTGRAESSRSTEPGKATGSVGSGEGAGRTGDANRNVARPPEQLAHRLAPMSLKTMAASQRWLETFPDDPGLYLKRRIEHEHAGRKERGVAAPVMTDRW